MVENSGSVPIASEVLIGQHHGTDNASSACFIAAIDPTYVVFSAGSNATYRHPRATTAARFLAARVDKNDIFRTDRGDHERGKEWIYGAVRNCNDPAGDDDVEIWLPDRVSEPIRIGYRYAARRCDSTPR